MAKKEESCKIFIINGDGIKLPLDTYLDKQQSNEYEKDVRITVKSIKRTLGRCIKPKFKEKQKIVQTKVWTDDEIRKEFGIMAKPTGDIYKDIAYIICDNLGRQMKRAEILSITPGKQGIDSKATSLALIVRYLGIKSKLLRNESGKTESYLFLNLPDKYLNKPVDNVAAQIAEDVKEFRKNLMKGYKANMKRPKHRETIEMPKEKIEISHEEFEKKVTEEMGRMEEAYEDIKLGDIPKLLYEDPAIKSITKALNKKGLKISVDINVRFGILKE